jgi:hypothetical protein
MSKLSTDSPAPCPFGPRGQKTVATNNVGRLPGRERKYLKFGTVAMFLFFLLKTQCLPRQVYQVKLFVFQLVVEALGHTVRAKQNRVSLR